MRLGYEVIIVNMTSNNEVSVSVNDTLQDAKDHMTLWLDLGLDDDEYITIVDQNTGQRI